jgi:hypothetical protein
MFDLRDQALTTVKRWESPIPATAPDNGAPSRSNPLDSEPAVQMHLKLLDAYTRELDRQEENRRQQAIDEEFYDNHQWDEADKRTLEERGQQATVYNVIATTVNWVLGTEKRGRSDFYVLPRRKESAKPAEKKTQLLKYLADCNRTQFHRSRAFADAVKVGVGWIEDGWDDTNGNEPIYSRYESWRNVLWDSAATELDLNDARYIFRTKWVDLDVMTAIFPDRKGLLELSARDSERFTALIGEFGDEPMDAAELEMERTGSIPRIPFHYVRQRVRVIEGWFRRPERAPVIVSGQFRGELFDEYSPAHLDEVNRGDAEVRHTPTMRMYVALFTPRGLLYLGPSPYRHNRYPFTPIWGNRRGKDGLPYGLIRGLRSVQESINKRMSKALWLLSTRRVIADEGAFDDPDAAAEEAAQPDAFLLKKPGKEVRIEDGRSLSEAELGMVSRDIMMVQQVGGVTDENLGRKTNATSGVAIERRQDQGAATTAHYFDNLRFALQAQGEKQLSLIEQFMTEEKQFRITNIRGAPEYVTVNDGLPENDIIRSKADFVIAEGDWRATIRQAQTEQLLAMMGKMPPEIALTIFDLVIENTDLPNRDEIVRRVRAVTGQVDPDADENDPEVQAQKQAQAQKAQLAQAIQQANLRKLVAEAMAKEMAALAARASAVAANVKAIGGNRGAIDIAADLLTGPAVAPVADTILQEAGFQGAPAEAADANAGGRAAPQAVREAAASEQQQQRANGAA